MYMHMWLLCSSVPCAYMYNTLYMYMSVSSPDICVEKPDEKAVMTYVSFLHNAFPDMPPPHRKKVPPAVLSLLASLRHYKNIFITASNSFFLPSSLPPFLPLYLPSFLPSPLTPSVPPSLPPSLAGSTSLS